MKKIFYLLIIGILFLIPNKVKAKMNDVSIDGVYTYYWNKTNNTYQSVEIVRDFYINGQDVYFSTTVDYYLNYFDVLINKTTFNGLNYGHYYDISGTLSIFDGIKHPNDNLFNSGIYIEPHNNISSRTKCLYNFTRVDKENGFSQVDFICPSVEIKENQAYLISVYTYDVHQPRVAFSRKFDFIEHASNDSVMQGIDKIQQTQDETNQKLDGINDTMNNSDVDMDGANSFFGDFSDTDHGGISGVVTAPLRFINKITQTCSPLSLDVLGANVQLPCGDTLFWNKPEVANFRTIWNILFGGAFLYLMITKLFKVIDGLKNPDDSRIEVMKL